MAKNCYRLLHCRNFLTYFRLVFLFRKKKQSQSGSVAEPLPFGAAPPGLHNLVMVAHQTSWAEVPGSNTASTTMILMR